MSQPQTKKVLTRLAKIKGHVQGISDMVEDGRPYPEVILQLVAVRSALNRVAQLILKDHAKNTLVKAVEDDFELELKRFLSALDMLL